MIWNIYPKGQYTRVYQGIRMGVGMSPALELAGVWNLLNLISPEMENIRTWPIEKPDEYPAYSPWLAVAAGTSFQQLPGQVETLGQMADRLTHVEFQTAVKSFSGLLPRLLLGDEYWAEVLAKTNALLNRHGENVVVGNFRRKSA